MRKVTPLQFPLAGQAARVALLTGILAGVVTEAEIKYAVAADVEPRPHTKPVVAWGHYFESIILAAEWAKRKYARKQKRTVDAWRFYIARKCNQDCWEGFYWSE